MASAILRVELSKQKGLQVQRACGRKKVGVFEDRQEASEAESYRIWGERQGGGQQGPRNRFLKAMVRILDFILVTRRSFWLGFLSKGVTYSILCFGTVALLTMGRMDSRVRVGSGRPDQKPGRFSKRVKGVDEKEGSSGVGLESKGSLGKTIEISGVCVGNVNTLF